MGIVYPTYFAPITQYIIYAQYNHVEVEVYDHFQKQTYRNRCYILGANGVQLLSVPLEHQKGLSNTISKDVRIDNSTQWQRHQLKTLETAYRSSPFYEFYEEEIQAIFKTNFKFLIDLQQSSFEAINDCIGLGLSFDKTNEFKPLETLENDYRWLVNAKLKMNFDLDQYTQVFSDRHGFVSNLSILDLVFNEGPNALNYLESQKLPDIKT